MGKGLSSVLCSSTLALSLLCPAQEKPDEGFLLARGQAGQIRIGMSVDELYSKIGRSHTKLVALFKEGFFDPALEIYLDDTKGASLPLWPKSEAEKGATAS